jgi:choline dehydrogenase-like flavoprotein
MNLNLKAKDKNTYDAIVVGSGISGGMAIKELCEKGLKVLLLERGRDQKHIVDYKHALSTPWELEYGNKLSNSLKEKFPIQSLEGGYPISESNQDFWLPDNESPYIQKKPFDWFRGNGIGGKSLTWGRQVYRWSDIDFEANIKENIAVDWPIRYKDLAPWYEHVEKFIGVSGQKLGLEQTPDSIFQKPMELTCLEKHVQQKLQENPKGSRLLTIGRVAHLTEPSKEQLKLGRGSCQYRNACSNGCPYGAYLSTQSSTLPAAMRTGNLTIRPFSTVSKILIDQKTKKATGVEVIDSTDFSSINYYSKIIFLNASAIGSTHILLNSVKESGLINESDQIGRNLMDHHSRIGAMGTYDGFEDKYFVGRRANGVFIPRFQNIGNDKRNYLRGFDYQGGASREAWSRNTGREFGADLKNKLTIPGSWTMNLMAYGECLPYEDNQISLHSTQKDKFGIPTLIFDAEIKENEIKMRKDMISEAREILEISGLKNIRTIERPYRLGLSKHEMGTARMGNDKKTSVLNKYNQVWEHKNVFVTDGACMTSSNCVNPSLTYMALTARAVDFAVKELKKGNL